MRTVCAFSHERPHACQNSISQYFRPRAVEKAQGGLTGEILIDYECEKKEVGRGEETREDEKKGIEEHEG